MIWARLKAFGLLLSAVSGDKLRNGPVGGIRRALPPFEFRCAWRRRPGARQVAPAAAKSIPVTACPPAPASSSPASRCPKAAASTASASPMWSPAAPTCRKRTRNYSADGLASWYGDDFHGRYTANGEIFDMNAITAAHPTLPLPSYARVTNLHNHKSIVVRVNDRGPYVGNRVIDLSVQDRQAARLLRPRARQGEGRICRPRAARRLRRPQAGGDLARRRRAGAAPAGAGRRQQALSRRLISMPRPMTRHAARRPTGRTGWARALATCRPRRPRAAAAARRGTPATGAAVLEPVASALNAVAAGGLAGFGLRAHCAMMRPRGLHERPRPLLSRIVPPKRLRLRTRCAGERALQALRAFGSMAFAQLAAAVLWRWPRGGAGAAGLATSRPRRAATPTKKDEPKITAPHAILIEPKTAACCSSATPTS